ncbi:cytidine deaminase-like protein [Phlebopus sp. FC_14]|nr:cytidine deaminase-like protein [Phlebopus sp. FC_14]
MNSPIPPIANPASLPATFTSPDHLLDHVTVNWRLNFVTDDLASVELVRQFAKRPFFMLVDVDAPLLLRYHRSYSTDSMTLEEFVRQNDDCVFGTNAYSSPSQQVPMGLRAMDQFVKLSVINTFQLISDLHGYLDTLDLLDFERLRPRWDTYFMARNTLADLASQRSNCMKRRVGAILVRENRIVATGYNGTPRGVTNCNEGGCARCNRLTTEDAECLCLHAEENALLEAGRDRVGVNATLFCNTCPCLKCTIKIIQSGVKEVVYNLSYKVDEASARLFKEAGVRIRRHVLPAAQ